jgi:predicted phosphodiesterase
MRLAILSDIHGNLEALRAVLDDLAGRTADHVVSLGDNIGYGADPEEVVQTLARLEIPSVLGNHELAAVQPEFLEWFNPSARRSLLLTMQLMSTETLKSLEGLPRSLELRGCHFAHGFPPESPTRYLFQASEAELQRAFSLISGDPCFVGHTHTLERIEFDGSEVRRRPLGEGSTELPSERRHIVNAGSVGQPRDGDNRAKYVVWETESRMLEIRCLDYDIATAARKIIDRGMPKGNADRLW